MLVTGLLLAAWAVLPGHTASVEPLVFTLVPSQTVFVPGDTLRLLAALTNSGPAARADLFAGVILPDGRVRMVTPALSLGPPQALDVRGLSATVGDALLPAGFAFPAPATLHLDTNGDGIADGAGVTASLDGWAPGPYQAFAALVEPGSAATGMPRLLVPLSLAPFEVRATGRTASSGAAALSVDGTRLYVVNPDRGSVSAVDTAAAVKIGEAAVGAEPFSLALGPEGRRLYVTSQRARTLSVLDAATLAVLGTVPVGAEPYGVVADPRGHLVYVASTATDAVEVVDARLGQVIARIPVGAKPKGLAITAGGDRLYVTHFLTGQVSVIDLGRRVAAQVIATGADSNMAQTLALHPVNGRAYLPHIRSNVSNRAPLFDTTVFPAVTPIDLTAGQALFSERIDLAVADQPVNLPFHIAFSPDGRRLYVVHMGSGDMSVLDLQTSLKVAHVDVGDGPRGLAVSPDGRRAYTANALSGDVSVVDLTTHQEIQRIPVTTSPLAAAVRRGKLLFFSSKTTDVSRERWMSCGSCHFEGDHDGRVWLFLPRGPRTTTTLRGAGQTRPLHWSADRDEVQDFELTVRQLQAGTGLLHDAMVSDALGPPNAGRSADLDALAAFVESMPIRTSPFLNPDGSLTPAALRGQAAFERADVGCLGCHPPPLFTDSAVGAGRVHDVGTGTGPDEGLGPAFDTPSLRQVWDRPLLLHDGRANSLREVLTVHNPDDRHGRTSHLTPAEVADLLDFLRSL
ncbi:MAG TPA: beta-propeller fold lactonase family protein [Candidatus Limnocylindrales bacterium]|nr:beta-propeller fold lactonase family protein [Candidatus Limnocylindrales bacterium]